MQNDRLSPRGFFFSPGTTVDLAEKQCVFTVMWKYEILPASLGIGKAKAKNKPFSVLNNRASSFLYKWGLASCFLCLPRVGYLLASGAIGCLIRYEWKRDWKK